MIARTEMKGRLRRPEELACTSGTAMLREDLDRYNEAGLRPGTLKYYRYMLRQAHTHPGMIAVIVFRFGGAARRCRIPIVRQLLDLAYHFLYTFVRFGLQIELPRDTRVGPGLRIDHYGSILINSRAVIGRNFTITHGVLVGGTETGAPTIGDDVHCGVGTKIIGGITLGNCIKIGAGAIVTKSFAGNVVLAGVPARALRELRVAPERNGRVPLAGDAQPACECGEEADAPESALVSPGDQE